MYQYNKFRMKKFEVFHKYIFICFYFHFLYVVSSINVVTQFLKIFDPFDHIVTVFSAETLSSEKPWPPHPPPQALIQFMVDP